MNQDVQNSNQRKLWAYCSAHTTPQSDVLHALERETHLKTLAPQMVSGHLQGELLAMFSAMVQPQRVLEIGTFTGYATLCLARGLAKGGVLHTIEANVELEYIIKKYINIANIQDRVVLHIGDAKSIIPTLDETFDLVFIDAGKADYALYYDLIFSKLSVGGVLLADNVLWSGKVANPSVNDADTLVLRAFNQKIRLDDRVEKVLLPFRDGLIVVRKLRD